MSVRRARADRHTPDSPSSKKKPDLDALERRVAELTGDRCTRLLHVHFGPEPPRVVPGCARCAEMLALWEQQRRDAPARAPDRPKF